MVEKAQLPDSKIFTATKLLAFLKHHYIVVPIMEDGNGIVVRYFVPCSLVHADPRDPVQSADSQTVTPSLPW